MKMKMKTTNFKSTAISLQLLFFCFILFQTVNAQKGDLVLNFSGKDAVTSNIVPLQSVKVSNETQGGDTTLYGVTPTLSLQWASGIFEQNHGQIASFVLKPNYPNPFTESTTVNIRRHSRCTLAHPRAGKQKRLFQFLICTRYFHSFPGI